MKSKKWISFCCIGLIAMLLTGCIDFSIFQSEPPYIEVTVLDEIFEGKFYYGQLKEDEKLVYREIYQGVTEHKKEICVHSMDGDLVNGLLHQVMFDYPEIFWTDGSGTSTTYDDTYTVLEPTYVYSKEERDKKWAEIEQTVSQIISSVPANSGEYDKIKFAYEYLVNTADYVEEASDSQNLYSALVSKQTVCAGYAKANQYLLEQLGIRCIYITGTATSQGKEENHAWNMVQCNGNYYYVDVTWADPLFAAGEEQPVETTNLVYDYLCCSESTLAATHVKEDDFLYPECNLDDLNYYRLNNMYYETASQQQLLNVMYMSINGRQDRVMFKFANSDVYSQAKDLIINSLLTKATQHLGRRYGLSEVKCYYKEEPELNKFSIYWTYE